MAKKTKEQKLQEKMAALLGLEAPTADSRAESNARSMEAEAALEYYENPRSFNEKHCKQCTRSFATRGAPVAYCSDPCRIIAFEERMGVKWQPLRPTTERWGFMGEPLTVPHEALVVVQAVMAEQAAAREVANEPIIDEGFGYGEEIAPENDPDLLDIFAEFDIS
jgi:hypothetical protein